MASLDAEKTVRRCVESLQGQTLAAFSCGFGDGAYPAFWGFDADGAPCCLIVDFLCFSEAE